MSKSGRRRREGSVEEEVLERLPRWRRELLRIRDRVSEEDKAPRKDERE